MTLSRVDILKVESGGAALPHQANVSIGRVTGFENCESKLNVTGVPRQGAFRAYFLQYGAKSLKFTMRHRSYNLPTPGANVSSRHSVDLNRSWNQCRWYVSS